MNNENAGGSEANGGSSAPVGVVEEATKPAETMDSWRVNPLNLKTKITYCQDWKSFFRQWQASTSFEEMMGLLQYGHRGNLKWFNLPENENSLLFYLEIANGFGRCQNFGAEFGESGYGGAEKNPNKYDLYARRQLVAWKAFQILATYFFKDQNEKGNQHRSWELALIQPRLLSALIYFFHQPHPRFDDQIANLDYADETIDRSSNHLKVAREFAKEMCLFILTFQRNFYGANHVQDQQIHELFVSVQPQVIEILHRLKEIKTLLRRERIELSSAGMKKLEELALKDKVVNRERHRSPTFLPRDIAEAVYGGSEVAEVYFILRTQKNVRCRLQRVVEAEQELADAEARVKALKGNKGS